MNLGVSNEEITNFLSKNVPDLEVVLIIDMQGNLIKNHISDKALQNYEMAWLKLFAMMISIRFPISGFNEQLGGLKITLNVFRDKAVLVKLLRNEQYIAVIIPWKTNSVVNSINIMTDDKFQ